MQESCAQPDLVRNSKTRLLLWGLPVAIILVTGYFAGGGWIMTIGWTLSLAVMGAACLVNARGCGRTHCYFTGPFFLLMAVASLLHGVQVLSLGPNGWRFIGAGLVLGGILLYVVPESIWGRYRREQIATHGC
jgi:drug/metabolite transporter (DMT)-like permease